MPSSLHHFFLTAIFLIQPLSFLTHLLSEPILPNRISLFQFLLPYCLFILRSLHLSICSFQLLFCLMNMSVPPPYVTQHFISVAAPNLSILLFQHLFVPTSVPSQNLSVQSSFSSAPTWSFHLLFKLQHLVIPSSFPLKHQVVPSFFPLQHLVVPSFSIAAPGSFHFLFHSKARSFPFPLQRLAVSSFLPLYSIGCPLFFTTV